MQNSKLQVKIQKFLISVWPLLFIFAIWFIFSYPYFLQNRAPFAATYQVNNFAPWDTYEKLWGPVKNGAMPDIINQIYPWRHLVMETWKSGQVPLWNPYSFSGTPLLANYQSAAFSPFNLLFFILPFIDGWSILVLLQPLLAGIFMYLFARSLSITKIGCLISAVSFMFCGFITVWMGYATLGYAILFLPLSLFCIEKYYQTQKNKFLILLSLTIPLSFFSGHFQISFYFFLFICIYILYKLLSTRNISKTLSVIIYTFFGLLLSMPQILPSIEFYSQSFRSSFFQKGGIPFEYLPTFLAPDFFGNPVTRNDWFGYYAEWNVYIGVIPLMLAIYAILSKKNVQTLFLFLFGIIAFILALSSFISNIIVTLHIPVLSTSALSRIIVLYSFAFTVLAGFGIDQLIEDIKNINKQIIIAWLGLFSMFFLILWFIVFQKLFIPIEKVFIAKQNLILPTFLFLISSLVIIFGSAFQKNKYGSQFLRVLPYFILFLVAFDMLRFAIKWQAFDSKHLAFVELPTTNAFSKITGFNRVLGNFGGEASVYYHLPSVEGYDALYSKRYGQFMGFVNNGEIIKSAWSVVSFPRDNVRTEKALNLLDIKYIVHKLLDNKKNWTFPFWIYPKDHFRLIYKDHKYEFYQNNNSFPHAFLVGEYRVVKDQKQILKTIFSKDFDLRQEIVLEEDPGITRTEGDTGAAKIVSYKQNNVEISVNAKSKALLFLSDNYYNGWKASVDGKNVPIFRADYTFDAIPVEAGKHAVRFFYDPLSFKIGILLGMFGFIGAMLTFLIPKTLARSISILSLRSEKDK